MSAWCFALHVYVVGYLGTYYVDVDYYSKLPVTGCRPSDVQSMSLSQVADHPMSSPCWVDRAGRVLAYYTIYSNDAAPASSPMISLLDIV